MSLFVASGAVLYVAAAVVAPAGGDTGALRDSEAVLAASAPTNIFSVAATASGPYARLDDLRRLAPGWDGGDAPAPNEAAIYLADTVITALLHADAVAIHRVAADVDGGVAIYIFAKTPSNAYAAFHCTNGGELVSLRNEPGSPVSAIDVNFEDISSEAQRAVRFVMGASARA